MKKAFTLSIESPCGEDFNSFKPVSGGGYCSSCQKNVVDFTAMSEGEIIQYFKNNNGKTCGRFSKNQLQHTYEQYPEFRPASFPWLKAAVAGFLLLFGKEVVADNSTVKPRIEVNQFTEFTETAEDKKDKPIGRTVKGTVTDEYGDPLPGASIVIKGTTTGTMADKDGSFTLHNVSVGDVLVVSFIGFETKEVKIKDSADQVIEMELVMDQYQFLGELTIHEVYQSENKGLLKSLVADLRNFLKKKEEK